MTQLIALFVAVGILAGIATWFFLAVGTILIWAAFVAWACFFHSGGDMAAFKSTLVCNFFGVVCAWVAALVIVGVPLAETLGLPLWGAIVVAVTVGAYVLAAHLPMLSSIPGTTYGYACTFAFLTQNPDAFSLPALTSLGLGNGLIVVPISMIIGACFGLASGKFAGALTKEQAA